MRKLTDPEMDEPIRSVLRFNESTCRLGDVAELVGCSEAFLREVMNSKGELSVVDRGMLATHFFTP